MYLVRSLVTIVLVCLWGHILCKISQQDLEHIKCTRKIKVIASSDDSDYDDHFQKFCFTISIEDKNKKIAYQQSIQRLSKIQRHFKRNHLIPDEMSLTMRKVETRMNRKRRVWTVIKTACFLSEINQQKFIERLLRDLGVKHYRAGYVGSSLNERELATKAFNNAKAEASAILDQISYRLAKVSNIEILGHHVKEEQKLEQQIQDNFNEGEDSRKQHLSSDEQDETEMGMGSSEIGSSTIARNRQLKPITLPRDQSDSQSSQSDQL